MPRGDGGPTARKEQCPTDLHAATSSPVSGLYVVLTAPTPGASSAALSRKHVFMKYLYFYSEYVAFETNSSCSVSPKITSCPANGSCQSWKDLGLSFR